MNLFDGEMAASYDKRFEGMAPLRDALHLVVRTAFSGLPDRARILVVGAGTGLEIAMLARHFPDWHFVAVDPSGPMLEILRGRLADEGLAARCEVHEGYLDSLPESGPFDAATALLVSQFLLDLEERRSFFREIARRLRPGGLLLSADIANPGSETLLEVWLRLQARNAGITLEAMQQQWLASRDKLSVLRPDEVEALLASAGFATPVQVYQCALIHGWLSRRG